MKKAGTSTTPARTRPGCGTSTCARRTSRPDRPGSRRVLLRQYRSAADRDRRRHQPRGLLRLDMGRRAVRRHRPVPVHDVPPLLAPQRVRKATIRRPAISGTGRWDCSSTTGSSRRWRAATPGTSSSSPTTWSGASRETSASTRRATCRGGARGRRLLRVGRQELQRHRRVRDPGVRAGTRRLSSSSRRTASAPTSTVTIMGTSTRSALDVEHGAVVYQEVPSGGGMSLFGGSMTSTRRTPPTTPSRRWMAMGICASPSGRITRLSTSSPPARPLVHRQRLVRYRARAAVHAS